MTITYQYKLSEQRELLMQQIYKSLIKILSLKRDQLQRYEFELEGLPQIHLEKFLLAYALKSNPQQQLEIINKFINYMNEQRSCKLVQDYLRSWEGVKVLACQQRKMYNFDGQERAYCLYGRGVSVVKRKGKQLQTQRNAALSQVEDAIFQLNKQNMLPLSKNQSHDIEDILMHFDVDDIGCDPLFLSNQLFSPFVPQPYALVLILPLQYPKQEQLIAFLKSSLLHLYVDYSNVLSKVMSREIFYKNTIVRGIYFIEEGQVQSAGGRVVARGWVSNGKCKSAGYGWRFKPMPFFKTIAKNQQIWKQFVNDLTLNQEYPFKMNFLLNLDDQINLDRAGKKGVKRFFLPKIGHGSIDFGKFSALEKVKHYDDRINEICDYKQRMLQRKGGDLLNQPLTHMMNQMGQKNKKLMLKHHSVSRSRFNESLSASSENILIMSVLKKLENLTQQSSGNGEESKERRDKIRISPAHLYQKARIMKKRRYQ